jgi:hypothetical protein
VIQRVAQMVTITIDGASTAAQSSASSFASLPALAQGTDVCIGVDTTVALTGALGNVCISSP